jgi:hypothetical protein
MWPLCRPSTIGGDLICAAGRKTMLHWSPRLVALVAALALVLLALGGLGFETYNLYW